MKKMLLVAGLVVLFGSLASAQTGSWFFYSFTGTEIYCNWEVFLSNSGGVVAGYDNLTTYCGNFANSPAIGFDASVPAGPEAHGKGAVYGDGIYDAFYDEYSGLQWTVFTKFTANKLNHYGRPVGAYGWEGVAGTLYGGYLGNNYGFLGSGAPRAEKGNVTKKTSATASSK